MQFKEYLQGERLPLTNQREVIVQAAFTIKGHFSAEDLANTLRGSGVKVGLATIYRTLGLLVSSRLLRELDFGEGFKVYEKIVDDRHHDHLICESCGRVMEFEVPDIERLQKEVIEQHHFRARSHKLEIYGLCRECAGRRNGIGERVEDKGIMPRLKSNA